jgi:hypothetical protein
MNYPNLFILGVQKAATTSLHEQLSEHPEIFSNVELKDIDYFARPELAIDPKASIAKYLKKYKAEKYILHSYVNYIIYPDSLDLIEKLTDKKAKYILVLRNPVDRAISAYKYWKKLGKEERSLEEAIFQKSNDWGKWSIWNSDHSYLEHGFYSSQLEDLWKRIPKDRILLVHYQDYIQKTESFLTSVYSFLEIEDIGKVELKQKNLTGDSRFKSLQKVLNGKAKLGVVGVIAKRLSTPEMRRRMKMRITDLNTKESQVVIEKSVEETQVREKLKSLYKEDKAKLIDMGVDFASSWK